MKPKFRNNMSAV